MDYWIWLIPFFFLLIFWKSTRKKIDDHTIRMNCLEIMKTSPSNQVSYKWWGNDFRLASPYKKTTFTTPIIVQVIFQMGEHLPNAIQTLFFAQHAMMYAIPYSYSCALRSAMPPHEDTTQRCSHQMRAQSSHTAVESIATIRALFIAHHITYNIIYVHTTPFRFCEYRKSFCSQSG